MSPTFLIVFGLDVRQSEYAFSASGRMAIPSKPKTIKKVGDMQQCIDDL
jgi:hypothetical protein